MVLGHSYSLEESLHRYPHRIVMPVAPQVPASFIQQFLLFYFITLDTFAEAGSKVFILQ